MSRDVNPSRTAGAPRPGCDIEPMRRIGGPAAHDDEDHLLDEPSAGARLRTEATRRAALRSVAAAAVAVGVAAAVQAGRAQLRPGDPTPVWVLLAIALVTFVSLTTFTVRVWRGDVADAGHLRAATVLPSPLRGEVQVRDVAGAAIGWRVRFAPGARELSAGERVWITGRGGLGEAPHLVAARRLGPGRHVLWASAESGLSRRPEPAREHDTAGHEVVDPEDPVS